MLERHDRFPLGEGAYNLTVLGRNFGPSRGTTDRTFPSLSREIQLLGGEIYRKMLVSRTHEASVLLACDSGPGEGKRVL